MKKTLLATCLLLTACSGVKMQEPAEDLITPLEQACLRQPLEPARWEQLAAALAVAGERERAATMYLQAASLRKHDVRQDHATLKQALAEEMPRTQVKRISAALVEVLRIPALAAASAHDDEDAAVAPLTVVRLEISNGNGVAGAAARLARTLEVDGLKTVRLSNLRPFVVPQSRIEYRGGQKEMAQVLARRLKLPLQPLSGTRASADMRIVLGHDARYLK
jgi:hypothetical protein